MYLLFLYHCILFPRRGNGKHETHVRGELKTPLSLMTMDLLVLIHKDEPDCNLFIIYAEDGPLFPTSEWKIDTSFHFS